MSYLTDWNTLPLFILSISLLLIATQLVIVVLDQLQKRRFGTVLLGTMITPMCTGFPNLMIGLFGQERFQGDLVLQLNIGNNLANTSLVIGLLLIVGGPLLVRPEKGKSKKAKRAFRDQNMAILFLWLGFAACLFIASDGAISRHDGVLLCGVYVLYQALAFRRRGKVSKKFRLAFKQGLFLFALLIASTWMIQMSLNVLDLVMVRVGDQLPKGRLGLFLGLLTVLPESFLLLRLAFKHGSLGLNGLIGDCLVSIPLVVGLSALFFPFKTAAFHSVLDSGARPFVLLFMTMMAITLLSLVKKPVPKKVGLIFVLLYAMVWFMT